MEIKMLLGNRLYLEIPEDKEESPIILDKMTRDAIESERMGKWNRLRVYAIGEGAKGLGIEEGDEVMIDPTSVIITRGVAKIPLSEERSVIMVSVHDIAHIW